MSSSTATVRAETVEAVVATLLPRASLLTRLLLRQGEADLSRTEVGMLSTLVDGRRRITELAETEALRQPSVTQLVDKLQRRGLVARERSPEDGRVVLVAITAAGRERLEAVRAGVRELLRGALEDLDDEELAELLAASVTLDRLAGTLRDRAAAQ